MGDTYVLKQTVLKWNGLPVEIFSLKSWLMLEPASIFNNKLTIWVFQLG